MESGAATPSLGHVGRHQLFPLSLTARGASDAQRRSSQPSSLEDPKGNRIQEGQGAGLRSVRHRVQGEPEGLDRVWALLCCGPYHSAVLFVSLRVQETPVFFLGCLDEIFYNQSDKEVVHLGTDDFLEDRMSFQSMGGTSQSERVWPVPTGQHPNKAQLKTASSSFIFSMPSLLSLITVRPRPSISEFGIQ